LHAADKQLVHEADKLILLFDPPFDHSSQHPGYIMGYPPGVRENGGRYTMLHCGCSGICRIKQGTRAANRSDDQSCRGRGQLKSNDIKENRTWCGGYL
jgi:cyclic beta-1,2-glucan synthetase